MSYTFKNKTLKFDVSPKSIILMGEGLKITIPLKNIILNDFYGDYPFYNPFVNIFDREEHKAIHGKIAMHFSAETGKLKIEKINKRKTKKGAKRND